MNDTSLSTKEQRKPLVYLVAASALVLLCGAAFAPDHLEINLGENSTWVLWDQLRLRIWSNLFVVAFFLLTIALGGTLFIALTYISGAGWHVAFRRIPESLAKALPVAGIFMLLVLGLRFQEYGWHHDWHGGPGTFWFKELWLTPWFWMIRSVAYVVVWSLLGKMLVSRSLKQDESGDTKLSDSNVGLSALFLAVYAVTFSLACVDWIMALDPLWFSTIWGVYNFSGMIQATLAVIIILGLLLRVQGRPLHGVFTDEHLHDLGRLMIGFSCFWMYIWFSQYMLIWYTNIPEETSYFIIRTHGSWGPVVVVSIILNWVIPFFVLLPQPAKRSSGIMMKVAIVVLIGRWVDLYVMIFPSTLISKPVFGIWEIASICCLVGAGTLLILRCFDAKNPVPAKDPYLKESLHYHAN
ncbi:MAG: hypothetical protein COA78_18370 [Blastopirellula sp.]|nr:MAG: hypothetical protein COA78_18370 [Blastopirellula sp.]